MFGCSLIVNLNSTKKLLKTYVPIDAKGFLKVLIYTFWRIVKNKGTIVYKNVLAF
jgi:hypothetical protein